MPNVALATSWIKMASVIVPGDPSAKHAEDDPDQKTWSTMAVFAVMPKVPVYVGFVGQYTNLPIMSNVICEQGYFALRVGPGMLKAVAVDADFSRSVELFWTTTVAVGHADFDSIPLYS